MKKYKGEPKAKCQVVEKALEIGGEPYVIKAYMKEGKTTGVDRTIRVRKNGGLRKGTEYHCIRRHDGEIRCSCPDFFFRARICKHLEACTKLQLLT